MRLPHRKKHAVSGCNAVGHGNGVFFVDSKAEKAELNGGSQRKEEKEKTDEQAGFVCIKKMF